MSNPLYTMLMKPLYLLKGIVRKGKKRGKKLGFPTANIDIVEHIPSGIYISKTKLEEKTYASLTFIGEAKTFNEKDYQAETWILDFNEDIYGKEISINLIQHIRKNEKFDSPQTLITQMKEDEKMARNYFKTLHLV